MSVNKYVRRKQGRSDSDHDILGIVLIIISVFLLLCAIVPIMFGVVGEVLRNVILGLFGLSAYAFLALTLAAGIGLLLHRKLNVTAGKIALVAGIAVSMLCILQLATTNNLMSYDYGDYLAEVYSFRYTAGGLIFGVIAYGVKSLINLVFAYVLFSLLFVACAGLLGLTVFKHFNSSDGVILRHGAAVKEDVKNTKAKSFTDDAPPQRVHMHSPTKLFVENIVPKNNGAEEAEREIGLSGLEDDAPIKRNIDQTYAFKMLYDDALQSTSRKVSEYDEQFLKNKAQSELYVTDYYKGNVNDGIAPRAAEAMPDVHSASESEIKPKKPDKIFHESKKLPDLVIPKQKVDADGFFNPSKIMNTDEAVRGGIISQSSIADDPVEPASSAAIGGFYTPSASDSGIARDKGSVPLFFDTGNGKREIHETYIKPIKDEPENTSPIINSDYFSQFEEKKEEPKSVDKTSFYDKTDDIKHVGLYDSFSAFKPAQNAASDVKESTERDDERLVNPIINSFNFEAEKTSSASKSDLSAVSEAAPQPSPSAFEPTVMPRDAIRETKETEEDKPRKQDFRSDSFIIDDTVVDLSEKREFDGEDNTGYYENFTETPPKPQSKKVISGQINIDSVPTVGADTVDIPQPPAPYLYNYPPVSLLAMVDRNTGVDTNDIENKSHDIEEVLASLKFPAKVVNVISGPTVTRYELQPQGGIPVRKILSLDKDLEFTLARGAIRIEAPVANKQAIGIEVANNAPTIVHFREIVESGAFNDTKYVLPLALGKDIGGDAIVRNLEKMPHLLIAGTTGTGKSVCLNTLILSLIYKCSPEDVRIVLVDPKQVEFTLYRELPHLLLRNPITDVEYAVNALDWLIDEMNRRYDIFSNIASKGLPVRNLAEYNSCALVKDGKAMKMPYIVMIVDELADLMSSRKKEVENRIRIITQKSRASGIHLVLATQRPSVDVITGTIKINLPSRIAFKVTANADSRTILDQGGAEALLGNGDMLLMNNSEPIRLQGAYVSNEEIVSVVEYVKRNNEAIFDDNIEKTILAPKEQAAEIVASDGDEESADEKLFPDIMRCLITNGNASTSLLQRRFSLGYSRASRIIDVFEQRKWVGPSAGAKPREVYMTESMYETVFGRSFNE